MAQPTIEDEQIEQFEATLHGDLIRPDDAEYDDARAVWNGMIDKYPELIARCRGAADVIKPSNSPARPTFAWLSGAVATTSPGRPSVKTAS